jgi:translation initiation factor IF-3
MAKTRTRVNREIRSSPIRLIDADGTQLGIVPLDDALSRATSKSLDLVEVGPGADPPVCRILDWGKVRFDREKKARESRKKAVNVEVKEVKYRPTIDSHDFEIKTKRARGFLDKGKKVKITVFFRYRQLRRPELGTKILDGVTESLADIGVVEMRSRLEGRQMTMIMAPLAAK